MMMNEFDDERTIEEEEELGQEDEQEEISALEKEQDMPIEELMRLYGYNKPAVPGEQRQPDSQKKEEVEPMKTDQRELDLENEPRHDLIEKHQRVQGRRLKNMQNFHT